MHRLDAARLFRLALEAPTAGAIYHAVGDEGVALRRIAEAIGAGLDLPISSVSAEDAPGHFGYRAPFVALDDWSTSENTAATLGFQPEHVGLLADIEHRGYLR